MRGQSKGVDKIQRRVAEEDSLQQKIYIDVACLQNYTSYVHGEEDMSKARARLLQDIDDKGVFSLTPPQWMTSNKPGVDAYVFIDDLALTLVETKDGQKKFKAANCLAPAYIKRNKKEIKLKRAEFTEKELKEIQSTPLQEVLKETRLSKHAQERFIERGDFHFDLNEDNYQDLQGKLASPPPLWANAAGYGQLVLLTKIENEELALPLVKSTNPKEDEKYVLSTLLSRSWVEKDLQDRNIKASRSLLQEIIKEADNYFSKAELEKTFEKEIKNALIEKKEDGFYLQTTWKSFLLKPSPDGWLLNKEK